MSQTPIFLQERRAFHASLLGSCLGSQDGIPTIADSSSRTSVFIARQILSLLGTEAAEARQVAQTSGRRFELVVRQFLLGTFCRLDHVRPGEWAVLAGAAISNYAQYSHLAELHRIAKASSEIASVLGQDYLIAPDVVVIRKPIADSTLNEFAPLVDGEIATQTPLRAVNNSLPLLHASISCKWTIRSDRAQNARSEALNLIRLRKGRVPHVAVVTAEPLPSRLASLALGTGDIDCLYHFALPELLIATERLVEDSARASDVLDTLRMMVDGKRLRDISDLPLDIAV